MASSIPRLRPAQVSWMTNFSAVITGNPASYGLLASDAVAIAAVVDPAVDAFNTYGSTNRVQNSPGDRTTPGIALMISLITTAITLCRQYAVTIQANAGVSDMDKIAAGIVPRNFTHTPLLVPAGPPVLAITSAEPGVHRFRFADTGSPDSPAKPLGAVSIQIWTTIAVAPAPTPADAKFYANFSANARGVTNLGPMVVYDPADAGKVSTLFGRWQGRRGDVGNWSLPVSMGIAF